ncbi:hypothetical protein [Burkholderia pyrrocinia]|uniref:hypothetical protein n=1 Tax=Burkholderia pyrrocinia TaxID=60550 RepID=UPI00105044DC|nr:hypothetical protein [Burkholderia pyrrocinia]TDA48796.1 hypothetical protein EVG18_03530 [Burkholderia pyrrocinia]
MKDSSISTEFGDILAIPICKPIQRSVLVMTACLLTQSVHATNLADHNRLIVETFPSNAFPALVAQLQADFALTPHDRYTSSRVLLIDLDRVAPSRARAMLEQAPRVNQTWVLMGTVDKLRESRPSWALAWPDANAIGITSTPSLGIHGLSIADGDRENAMTRFMRDLVSRSTIQSNVNRPSAASSLAMHSAKQAASSRPKQISTALETSTPSLLCVELNNELYQRYFDDVTPSESTRMAFVQALSPSCQYGTLSTYTNVPSKSYVPGFEFAPGVEGRHIANQAKLSLQTEWMLVKSDNQITPSRSNYLFWVKTVNEGAGSGMTRDPSHRGALDSEGSVINILNPVIHSGWGPLANPSNASSWYSGDRLNLFRCENAFDEECARQPMLLRLQPENSFDQTVTIANATAFNVGATITPNSSDTGLPSFSTELTFSYTNTRTSSREAKLTQTQTYGNATYFRSTEWKPQWPAIKAWLNASGGRPQLLDTATPLASTLNPSYDILWQLPAAGNTGGIPKPYSIVYEARWQHCDRTQLQRGPGFCPRRINDRTGTSLPWETRTYWKDTVTLHLE